MIGRTLDHYRIESKLGEGGMGVVYKARDVHLNRTVALKVLPPEKIADPDRRERFVREARAASALNHPNIVAIYDIRSEEGVDFMVMEHVEGRTLDEVIPPKGIPVSQTLRCAVQIADALARAHGAGILHRDIKPSNLMLTPEGRVKILDFGLAKLAEPVDSSPEAPTMTRPLTEVGVVVGTAPYMSPEQAEGRPLDARSDIFSFGAVLYEMVTGRKPFSGDSRIAILHKILHEEPPPPAGLAEIPPDLQRAVLRCLRKDPARRYQTMADLKVALEDLEAESASGRQAAVRAGARRSRRPWLWAAIVPALAAAAFFAWRAQRASTSAEPLRAIALTTLPGVEFYPSFSHDGDDVAFTWTEPKQDNPDIYVQRIGSGSPLRLTTDPLNDYNPVWSPDGRWIAFLRSQPRAPSGLRSRELRLIPSLGGPERNLADIRSQDFAGGLYPDAVYLAWSPDSSSLVVTDSPGEGQPDALFVVSLETGERRRLTNPRSPVLADTSPAVSPDGRSLAFLRRTSWGSGELHLLPLGKGLKAAGEPERLTPAELRADYPAWMPDGKEIIFAAKGSLWRLAVAGENEPTRIPYVGEDGSMPAISRSQPGKPARLAYVRSFADGNIWRIETSTPGAPASSAPVMAISSSKPEYHVEFSPDGRRVAFISTRSGDPEIWLSDPDGSNAVQLTSMGARDTNCPHWSPDGQLIAFSSTLEGEFDVYVVPAAGGKPRRLTSHPAVDLNPRFSRDGKRIYFSSMRSGDYRIWKMPAAGGDAVQVTPNQGSGAFESPDGSNLYYLTFSVVSPVWRLPTSGGEPVQVLDGVVWFNFWLLEKGAYYIDRLGDETRLGYLDFVTGKSSTVARNLGQVTAGLTASPDGRTILFTRVDSSADDLMLVENFR
jgi:Tol biopolymer transport system component/tRNA A-37 threonylcarbamoyl transferase component Bud32